MFLDARVEVFNASVGKNSRRMAGVGDLMGGVGEYRERVCRLESVGNRPGENHPREMVDHSMKAGTSSVQEPNHRGIDVAVLIWLRRSNADLRLCRMNSSSWPSPAVDTNESVPCRRGGEDLGETLGEDRERAGRDVTVLLRGDHLFDDSHLLGRELMRGRAWTGGNVVESAALLALSRVIARRGKPQDAPSGADREVFAGSLNGTKEEILARAVSDSRAGESDAGDSEQDDDQPEDGGTPLVSIPQTDDLPTELRLRHLRDVESDDRW